MSRQLELRREVFSLLSWHLHRADASPRDTLLRMIKKSIGDCDDRDFQISEKRLGFAALARHVDENHGDANPKRIDAPIILFTHKKKNYLIDGQNRLNHFSCETPVDPIRCLFIKFKK